MRPATSQDHKDIKVIQKDTQIRVLLIDDDLDTTELLKMSLEPNEFEVFVALSGKEGIQQARELIPDVIILDLLMPDLDGLKVVEEVRKFSQVPIIILSAMNKPNIAAQALDLGADDYLIKPMNNNLLIANINKLARRGRIERNGGLKTGNGSK